MQSPMERHGLALVEGGFSVLPIAPREKYPARHTGQGYVMLSWERYRTDPAIASTVRMWGMWPECGVGIICGKVVAVDIDIEDETLVQRVYGIINKHLGVTPAVRIGREPRKLLVYRTDRPFRKIRRGPVEVLADGQQFVAYGIHPAGHDYRWPGQGLSELRLDELPEVTEERVIAALEEVWEILPASMKASLKTRAPTAVEEWSRRDGSVLGQSGNPEAIENALLAIPNDDLHWDDWNKIAMAVYAALGEDGLPLFDNWSRQSSKYGGKKDNPFKRWTSFRRSPPTQIGAGTIYHLAQSYGWRCPPEMTLQPVPDGPEPDISGLLAQTPARPQEAAPAAAEPDTAARPEKPTSAPPQPAAEPAVHSFPMEWFDSPSLIGEAARWVLSTAEHEHPPFALYNVLCAAAAIVGRRYSLERFQLHPNLFVIAVAQPGSGKDHSRKRVKKLMGMAGLIHLLGPENFTGGEAIQRSLYKSPSMLSQIDEIGKYLEVVKGSRSDTKKEFLSKLLTLYSQSNDVAVGTGYVDATDSKARRYDIQKPNFNLFGTTNPTSLASGMTKAMKDDGTIARLLFAPAIIDFPYPRDVELTDPSKDLIQGWRDLYAPLKGKELGNTEMPDVAPEPTVVKLDPAAEELRADLKHEEHQLKAVGRKCWGRLVENSLKVAMIEAIASLPSAPVITADMLDKSARLVRWSYQYGERLMDYEVSTNQIESLQQAIMRELLTNGTCTMGQILKAVGHFSTRTSIMERLDMMVRQGEIILEDGKYRNR